MNTSIESKQSQPDDYRNPAGNYDRPSEPPVSTSAQRRSGTIYRVSGNLLIIKDCQKTVPNRFVGSTRGNITGFSHGARGRMSNYLRSCMADYTTMVTLTYPFSYPSNGKAVKEHLRRFLQECKREYVRHGGAPELYSSFWFLEFQQRGAPHFHIFATWSPDRHWVSKRWFEIVGSEDTRHLAAGTKVEFIKSGRAGTISYAAKYAAKQEQKAVPDNYENVGRFWGVYGRRTVLSADTFVDTTESCFRRTYQSLKALYMMVNKIIFEGNAQTVIRKHGCVVISFNEPYDIIRVSTAIHRISAQSGYYNSIFCDAELDYGETYA